MVATLCPAAMTDNHPTRKGRALVPSPVSHCSRADRGCTELTTTAMDISTQDQRDRSNRHNDPIMMSNAEPHNDDGGLRFDFKNEKNNSSRGTRQWGQECAWGTYHQQCTRGHSST